MEINLLREAALPDVTIEFHSCRYNEGNYYSKPQGEQQSYRDPGIGTFHF